MLHLILLILFNYQIVFAQHNPNQWINRSGIVHLFEWKFTDIGNECVQFLAPSGYAGVQISPVNENAIIAKRPWWERYQPISYKIITRSGSEQEFHNMVIKCNSVGVRIYVDIVLNHMASGAAIVNGTGGSTANIPAESYPSVPYEKNDFHPTCTINNYMDKYEVRNCQLVGLPDLNQSIPEVHNLIVKNLNHLIDLGVAGFRVDAAKHMWPNDLKSIYQNLKNLTNDFPPGSRPFIYQEVIDYGNEAVKKTEYSPLGVVTEFRHSMEISRAFLGNNQLKWMNSWGPKWDFLTTENALVFVDNHDNQRAGGPGGASVLTYKQPRKYRMALAFMLAHPYGQPRVMSSYKFSTSDQGPPADINGNIISPSFSSGINCQNGWICEHRWPDISNMIGFRNAAANEKISYWWDNGNNQIAFARGGNAFIVLNNENAPVNVTLTLPLPTGHYCDIITGSKVKNSCSGRVIYINAEHRCNLFATSYSVLAIHIKAKLES